MKDKDPRPISAGLYTSLRADILSGALRDGSKLSEASICKKYNVSRTPVRAALQQLEADGLVRTIPNRGAFVTGLTTRDISDIFDLRVLLEVQAAEWAIMRMSTEDLDRLSETLDFMELYTLRNDAAKVMDFNSRFHNIIYDGTGDRMIKKALLTYKAYLRHALPHIMYPEEELKAIFEEHKAIYIAFESRNPEAGRIAMKRHMENSGQRRFSALNI